MKIDIDDKPRLMGAILLMAVAVVIATLSFFTISPHTQASAQMVSSGSGGWDAMRSDKRGPRPDVLDPRLHYGLLQNTESVPYAGSGRNIFANVVEQRAPQLPPAPNPSPRPKNEQPQTVAAIPLRFFGYAKTSDSPRKVFVREEDSLFVGSEGEVIDRRYRIAKIGSTSVDVEDLLDSRRQTLILQRD